MGVTKRMHTNTHKNEWKNIRKEKKLILFSLQDNHISYNKQDFEKKGDIYLFIYIYFPKNKGIFNFILKGGYTNNILYNRFQT